MDLAPILDDRVPFNLWFRNSNLGHIRWTDPWIPSRQNRFSFWFGIFRTIRSAT